jgi:regulator of sigma E protease
MLIAVAGPVSNFLLAFVLMTCAYMLHNEVDEFRSGAAVTDYISPGSPVAKTGIQSGDTIVRFDNVNNPTWDDVYQHSAAEPEPDCAVLIYGGWPARGHQFFVASTATTPDEFSPDTLGFVPKMQATPVKVAALLPDSPATARGCRPGDQIVSIDALQIHSVPALLAYMQDQKGSARGARGAAQWPDVCGWCHSGAHRC